MIILGIDPGLSGALAWYRLVPFEERGAKYIHPDDPIAVDAKPDQLLARFLRVAIGIARVRCDAIDEASAVRSQPSKSGSGAMPPPRSRRASQPRSASRSFAFP